MNNEQKAQSRDAKFWDRIAKKYAAKPVADQDVYEQKLARTNRYLTAHDQVLEIGCGTGTTALFHASRVASILATDISANMINIARDKAQAQSVANVEFEVARVEELISRPDKFDVILAHSILHLVPKVEVVVSGLASILKPQGLLITTTACIADFMPLFRYIAPVGRAIRVFPYVNVFKESEYRSWLEKAGFEIEESWLPAPKRGLYTVTRKK